MITVRNLEQPAANREPTKAELFKEFCCKPETQPEKPRPALTATIEPQPRPQPAAQQPETQPTGEQTQAELDELHRQAQLAAKFGAAVCITGQWVWATFNGMPSGEVRAALKAEKWIWCNTKKKWAYRGAPSHSRKNMPWDYILNKYGEEKVNDAK